MGMAKFRHPWLQTPERIIDRRKFTTKLSLYGMSIIVAELWRPEVGSTVVENVCENLRLFGKKTTPCGKVFKIRLQKDSSRHRSTCCVQISWNLTDRKPVKSCVTYRIVSEICLGQPRIMHLQRSRFHPNRFTFGGVIREGVNTVNTGY